MTPLADILDCFEGVIPSVVATLSPDGVPNVSYLSQVWLVDEQHVALSNQFFSKTALNVQATGRATVLVVDGRTGAQHRLDLRWERSEAEGELFDRMAAHLRAISTLHGTDGLMQLRSAEIYRVADCSPIPSAGGLPAAAPRAPGERLAIAARLAAAVAGEREAEAMVDRALAGLEAGFGFRHVMALVCDDPGGRLLTLASRGYAQSGVGSEVAVGQGSIGIAAETGQPVRLCDMSRGERFARAVRARTEADPREIPLPGLPRPQSQLAVPLKAQGRVWGVLFAESEDRFRFGREDQDALVLIAAQLAASLRLAELQADPAPVIPAPDAAPTPAPGVFRVRHFRYDDSVFIDGAYVIKGVPGRLLMHFLQAHAAEGRRLFSNREVRLDPSLRLPDLKDNLETRLILLRRRLEERAGPVRIARPARGQIELVVQGRAAIESAD